MFSRFPLVLALASLAVAACGVPDVNGSAYRRGLEDDDVKAPAKTRTETTADDTSDTDDEPTLPSSTDAGTPTPIADADQDGIADDVDCDPNNASIVGTKLAVDPLATDTALFAPAVGFANSWSYDQGYVQTRLANLPDLALLQKEANNVTDATVEIIGASTEITGAITPVLRQMFITFGTKVEGGTLSAIGCGVEVDGSQTVTQKTSIVQLNGGPTSVASTPRDRVDRGAVQAKEEFKIKATLRNSLLTCDVTIKGNQTTRAEVNVGTTKGSIGLFTRQTKALFRQINACKLK